MSILLMHAHPMALVLTLLPVQKVDEVPKNDELRKDTSVWRNIWEWRIFKVLRKMLSSHFIMVVTCIFKVKIRVVLGTEPSSLPAPRITRWSSHSSK